MHKMILMKCVTFLILNGLVAISVNGHQQTRNRIKNDITNGVSSSERNRIDFSPSPNVNDVEYSIIKDNFYEDYSSSAFFEDYVQIPIPKNEVTLTNHFNDLRFNRGDVEIRSNVLEVPYGREMIVDPHKHLNIMVKMFHTCIVKVVDQEDFKGRAGLLLPTVFDCNFSNGSLIYRHLGARMPHEDAVRLLIKYDTRVSTFIIPTYLRIKVIYDQQLDIVTKNLPIRVNIPLGISNEINQGNTMFLYDENIFKCYVTILSYMFPLPEFGKLISKSTNPNLKVTYPCNNFLMSKIAYQHRMAKSTQTDAIPFKVELFDKQNELLTKREFFRKIVLIPEGKSNSPPSLVSSSTLRLDVNNPGLTAVTNSIIQISDQETPMHEILLVIKQKPQLGTLVHIDNPHLPMTSFYQKDLDDYKIAYEPPDNYRSFTEQKTVSMALQAIDSYGLSSDEFEIIINLEPIKPDATLFNSGLQLFEGQSEVFDVGKNFHFISNNNQLLSSNISFQIIGGPKHGEVLVTSHPSHQFSLSDLNEQTVRYVHDSGSSVSDNLLLRMIDRNEPFEFLFPINVFPLDDEPPTLVINRDINVKPKETINIPSHVLKASDNDSDDRRIKFQLQYPYPKYGDFVFKQKYAPVNPSTYNYIDGYYEKDTSRWTQQDIEDGKLYFTLRDYTKFINGTDAAYVILFDDSTPPNQSQKFKIKINIVVDSQKVPTIFKQSKLLLKIPELQNVRLNQDLWEFSGRNANPEDIVYTLNTDEVKGSFSNAREPLNPITTFNQQQVNNGEIIYRPPSKEVGLNAKEIILNFVVKNQITGDSDKNNVTVLLQPINNKPPSVHVGNVIVPKEKIEILISNDLISIVDEDTEAAQILIRVSAIPEKGHILYNKTPLINGSEFTMKDIENGNIKYRLHPEKLNRRDQFSLEVDDRLHKIKVPFNVTIEDRETDDLNSFGDILNPLITVSEGDEIQIANSIWGIQPDLEANAGFIIETAPFFGRLVKDEKFIMKFSWDEVNDGKIFYVHNGEEVGEEAIFDNFTIIVTDLGLNIASKETDLNRVTVEVKVIPVDNSVPVIEINQPLQVDEGGKTVISEVNVLVYDEDTEPNRVSCMLTKQPEYGFITNISNDTNPISSFTVSELWDAKLIYQQSIHYQIEPKSDLVSFYCSDYVQDSLESSLPIIIHAQNDEKPLIKTAPLNVHEGHYITIDNNSIAVTDLDEPADELVFSISRHPTKGHISIQDNMKLASIFTWEDLVQGKLFYYHDDSDSVVDSIRFDVTDGNEFHTQTFTLDINILSVDDTPPQLLINEGITVKVNESKVITTNELLAIDSEFDNTGVRYELQNEPKFGLIQLYPQSNRHPIKNLSEGSFFTQEEIDLEIIGYKNTDYHNKNDSIVLRLSDGALNYPTNHTFTFNIGIEYSDVNPPALKTKQISIDRNGLVYLTPNMLNASDANTNDASLIYKIIRGPNHGQLRNVNAPTRPVTEFSQHDIDLMNIVYVHDPRSINESDMFEFILTDGVNEVKKTFFINVINSKPEEVLIAKKIVVYGSHSKIITDSELNIINSDVTPDKLMYVLTKSPRYGAIFMDKEKMVYNFTQEDINNERVSYRHTSSARISRDRFQVKFLKNGHGFALPVNSNVTQKSRMHAIDVQILHEDNKSSPKITINDGAVELEAPTTDPKLSSRWKGMKAKIAFKITKYNLNVNHPNSSAESIIYIIDEQPKYGYVCHLDEVDHQVSNFSQCKYHNYYVLYLFF